MGLAVAAAPTLATVPPCAAATALLEDSRLGVATVAATAAVVDAATTRTERSRTKHDHNFTLAYPGSANTLEAKVPVGHGTKKMRERGVLTQP